MFGPQSSTRLVSFLAFVELFGVEVSDLWFLIVWLRLHIFWDAFKIHGLICVLGFVQNHIV